MFKKNNSIHVHVDVEAASCTCSTIVNFVNKVICPHVECIQELIIIMFYTLFLLAVLAPSIFMNYVCTCL